MSSVEQRLADVGRTVPEVVPPVAAYIPAVRSGSYVYTSGQLPMVAGALAATGKVGAQVTADDAKELAATCAINAIAAVKSVIGDQGRWFRCVRPVIHRSARGYQRCQRTAQAGIRRCWCPRPLCRGRSGPPT